MHFACLLLLFTFLLCFPAAGQLRDGSPSTMALPLSDGDTSAVPGADELLENVIRQLPREPLQIRGEIVLRRRRGIVERELLFELLTEWGRTPARATYTILDGRGKSLERLVLSRGATGKMGATYSGGDPLKEAVAPKLSSRIQGTDVTWLDLTLSFLWWRGGEVIRNEAAKGRMCHVVAVTPPAADEAGYAKVCLWIDRKLHMLLQAEGYDKDGKLLKRLWVDSFKKIDERWMIKDMEIQSYPLVHRTLLRIHEVHVKE